jgi:acetyltransferase EpsM
MSETPLLICGTRTFAEEIADLASEVPGYRVVGFVENLDPARCEETLEGLPITWIEDIVGLTGTHVAVCALVTTRRHFFTRQVEDIGMSFATLVHPSARVSSRSSLGEGTIVGAGAVVAAHTLVGRHVLLNRGALVGHHTTIGDHASLLPGSNVAGNCTVGERAFIGMGALVLDNLTVGRDSVIGAGAVVTRDVPANVQVLGAPARIVKEGIEGR